ncbi:hypothetical protein HOR91_gp08 [Xanthomonas phage phi Xc10]|uniref:Uncharacterized protein n=1 Tax=Xanthomonas phage phi Xc10 TaxID=2024237 RepID=A0A249XLC2_9CAUD|nr:hypothetical protein HOR91_gp08 [Xanthomonas phage phi Xc10]ASZ72007.1 hypothetical protein [Xanthomonas phage phi Xc10]
MRKLWLRILILLYWIVGRGPWVVVGQYHDDDGKLCRFRTGPASTGFSLTFDDLDAANDYCDQRNWKADTDPLGTTYYVWHETEFNHFGHRRK